jgi:hypothetical protein
MTAAPRDEDDAADAAAHDEDAIPTTASRLSPSGDSIPSLDDTDALQSVPEDDGTDSIPSLDDSGAVIAVPAGAEAAPAEGEPAEGEPAEAAAADAAAAEAGDAPSSSARSSSSPGSPGRGGPGSTSEAGAFDQRQIATQLVSRPRGLRDPDATVVAPAPGPPPQPRSIAVAVVVVVVGCVVLAAALLSIAPSSAPSRGPPPAATERTPKPAAVDVVEVPDAALADLRTALATGNLARARERIAQDLWPSTQLQPPPGLASALATTLSLPAPLPWHRAADGTVRLAWEVGPPLPGLGRSHALSWAPREGRWQVVAWRADGIDDGPAVFALLSSLRTARDAGDGAAFVALLRPGPSTCTAGSCAALRRAVSTRRPHPVVDAALLSGIVEGSLRARRDSAVVRLRALRPTRMGGVAGVVDVDVAPGDRGWQVVAVDTSHVDAVEREAAVWTTEHAALAWRSEVAGIVALEPLPVTCARPILAWCADERAPTRLKNVSRTAIRRVQVTKVTGGGRDAASPWAIWTDIAPGAAVDTPTRTSPAPAGRGFEALRNFDSYRVDWIELAGGRRLAPSTVAVPRDGPTLEAARRAAGADVARMTALRARTAALGYSDEEVQRLLAARAP